MFKGLFVLLWLIVINNVMADLFLKTFFLFSSVPSVQRCSSSFGGSVRCTLKLDHDLIVLQLRCALLVLFVWIVVTVSLLVTFNPVYPAQSGEADTPTFTHTPASY